MSTESMAAAIAILRVAYPGEFGDEAVAFYARKLADLDPDDVVGAVDRLTNRMRFRPTVADIRVEIAEAQLGLPPLAEAWAIASKGDLRNAPACVREAADFVGGRWAIATSENPATLRAQFRQAYEITRDRAVLEAAGAALPTLPVAEPRPALPAGDPEAEFLEAHRVPMPLVLQWQLAIDRGEDVEPNDAVRADALRVLRAGPWTDVPGDDMLYRAAEHVMAVSSGEVIT